MAPRPPDTGPLLRHFRYQPQLLEKLFERLAATGVGSLYVEHLNLRPYIRERLWHAIRDEPAEVRAMYGGASSGTAVQHGLRWFVGLNRDEQPWDASTFSQNRCRRFNEAGLFDETVKRAMSEGFVRQHISADGPLVRANGIYNGLLPIGVAVAPEGYKRRLLPLD